ncbi:metal ABC transporter ATP-binding protein [Fuchsiella alkaliacetigena]|nr:metal ABC transporter ATP-binding protein [Fuchsiella alkaliacetigena]
MKIKDLCFSYNKHTVLTGVNLEIDKGDFVAFIGPNGSGKSTLAKLIVNILKVQSGEIKIFNKSVSSIKDWTKIGYISQKKDFNFSFPATVEEVVGANLYQEMGWPKFLTSELKAKVSQTLELVGISAQKKTLLGELSGGQQQRVFIARALVTEPEIIILDEPLTGVDSQSQLAFYRLISRLNRDLGITIILISHNIEQIAGVVNKIFYFKDQRVLLTKNKHLENISYKFALKAREGPLKNQPQAVDAE